MDFEPLSWRKNSSSRRRRDSEFVWKIGGKSVGRASRFPRSGVFCIFFYKTGAGGRARTDDLRFTKALLFHLSPVSLCLTRVIPARKAGPDEKQSSLLFIQLSYWSRLPDSNWGPSLYKSVALPTELRWQLSISSFPLLFYS